MTGFDADPKLFVAGIDRLVKKRRGKMKKLSTFRRIAIITAASFGAVALSSSAQAQPDPGYCHQYAWQTCSYDEWGNPIQVTFECYSYYYEQCMGGSQAALDAYTRD